MGRSLHRVPRRPSSGIRGNGHEVSPRPTRGCCRGGAVQDAADTAAGSHCRRPVSTRAAGALAIRFRRRRRRDRARGRHQSARGRRTCRRGRPSAAHVAPTSGSRRVTCVDANSINWTSAWRLTLMTTATIK